MERQLFEQQLGHSLDPENSEDDALSVEAILLDRDLELDGDRVVGKSGKDYLALRQDWQRRKQGNTVLDSRRRHCPKRQSASSGAAPSSAGRGRRRE